MAQNPEKIASELFSQAAETFSTTLQTGVKVQEEWADWWSKAAAKASSAQEWQKQAQAMVEEAIPAAQKSSEEYLHAIDEGCKTTLELLHKAFETGQSESMADLRAKTQEIWEASLRAMRQNAETAARANAQALSSWANLANQARVHASA
jgi:DNA anti-recombination protein RmuC